LLPHDSTGLLYRPVTHVNGGLPRNIAVIATFEKRFGNISLCFSSVAWNNSVPTLDLDGSDILAIH
jgi:hypothetical protein